METHKKVIQKMKPPQKKPQGCANPNPNPTDGGGGGRGGFGTFPLGEGGGVGWSGTPHLPRPKCPSPTSLVGGGGDPAILSIPRKKLPRKT